MDLMGVMGGRSSVSCAAEDRVEGIQKPAAAVALVHNQFGFPFFSTQVLEREREWKRSKR